MKSIEVIVSVHEALDVVERVVIVHETLDECRRGRDHPSFFERYVVASSSSVSSSRTVPVSEQSRKQKT